MHNVGLLGVTVTDGSPSTCTVTVPTLVQVACEPKIEYVVVIVGLAVVFAPMVVVNAMFGDQEYVDAPLAVKLMELPKQITAGLGSTVTVGLMTTVAVPVCVWLLQPTLEPITLYTVVTAGLAITTGPFAVFKVADGVHVYVVALFAVKVTLVPAHMLAEVTAMIGLAIAFNVNVAWFVQVPLAPNTVPVMIAAPLDVPMMLAPFNVLVVKPMIGPHVYEPAPEAVNETVFGEPL